MSAAQGIEIVESSDYGIILKCLDPDLADQFDDFLNERAFVLFNVRFENGVAEFLFGQAASSSRVQAIFEKFWGTVRPSPRPDLKKFLNTVYLGDRACKGLRIESWNERLEIHVDCISRIRSASGEWEFNTEEDIPDGRIVFTGLSSLELSPGGLIPNDAINAIDVHPMRDDGGKDRFLFEISIGSCDQSGRVAEVLLRAVASDVHIEDPARPGVVIR